ncbi:winged helix-turn-helix domain-containing protein [Oceanobacillus sp. CF4.6]|uniref:winged helix-turn-helix domain-containing protein n=1 Tax=Oceanobacillus sp. CF4.6 TaxID=3373080 RepID=UPI003EE5F517
MAISGFQDFMYPFLQILKDGKEHRLKDLYKELAVYFKLMEEEIEETLQLENKLC